jgi:O-antigen ligase
VLWLLAALLVLTATVRLPDAGAWLGVKAFALEAGGILLALWVLSRGEWTRERVQAAFLAAPNVAILLFLAWVGLSAALSQYPEYSRADAMRHLGGGLVYFAIVYGVSPRQHLERFSLALALTGGLSALIAFANVIGDENARISGAYHNEQLLAGVLLLLAPVVLMASRADEEPWRRNAGLVAAVLMAIGIVVTQNRSAWGGTAAALLLMGVLSARYRKGASGQGLQKHTVAAALLVMAAAVGLFLGLSRMGSALSYRADSLTVLNQTESYRWRAGMWIKAFRMARDRPVLGWGVGTFPINQALYYHPDAPSLSQRAIIRRGPSLWENAHNTYLTLAAELGFTGLALYLGILGAFFVTGVKALKRGRRGIRQAVLIGCMAAIAGQMVSGIGNPAWEYAQCSLFFWTVFGLGMAAAGLGDRGRELPTGARPEK